MEQNKSKEFTDLCYEYIYDLETLRDRARMLLKRIDWAMHECREIVADEEKSPSEEHLVQKHIIRIHQDDLVRLTNNLAYLAKDIRETDSMD